MNSCCSAFTPEGGCTHWGPQIPDNKSPEEVIADNQEYYDIMHGRGDPYK